MEWKTFYWQLDCACFTMNIRVEHETLYQMLRIEKFHFLFKSETEGSFYGFSKTSSSKMYCNKMYCHVLPLRIKYWPHNFVYIFSYFLKCCGLELFSILTKNSRALEYNTQLRWLCHGFSLPLSAYHYMKCEFSAQLQHQYWGLKFQYHRMSLHLISVNQYLQLHTHLKTKM